jgi:hypothetical protein
MMKRPRPQQRSPAMIVALLSLLVAVGGVAVASIPGPSGVITACYSKSSGTLRVIDSKKTCSKKRERTLRWNQQGPRGLQGFQGQPGNNGNDGQNGTAGRDAASAVMGTTTTAIPPMSSGTSRNLAPSGPGVAAETSSQVERTPNATIVARDLSVHVDTAPAMLTNLIFTLVDDGATTPVTCKVTAGTQTCDSGAATATISPGSQLTLRTECELGPFSCNSTQAEWGWRATTP